MDAVTTIVTALSAGATVGGVSTVQDDVKDAVRAAYAKLRELTRQRFDGDRAAELALDEHAAHPEVWETPLAAKLRELGADSDLDLITAARDVLALLAAAGTKFNVNIYGSTHFQVGDSNSQMNIA